MVVVDELPRYFTIEQAAHVTGAPESRFRTSWVQIGLVRPATRKGGIQFDRPTVTRAAVYTLLQGVFGQVSPVATELAKAATPAQLDTILGAERPQLDVVYRGLNYSIQLDAAYFAQVRARMAEIPR